MANEIVPQKFETGARIQAVIPRNAQELHLLASELVAAGVVPMGLKGGTIQETISKVSVVIMQGLEVGFGPMRSMSTIAVINGRPTIYGDGVTALLHNGGAMSRMHVEEIGQPPAVGAQVKDWPGSYGVKVTLTRKGSDSPYVGEFTVDDARRANLWLNPRKQPWIEYPKRMLKWRALAFAARDGFSDCLGGMMIREEVEDIPDTTAPRTVGTAFLDDAPVIDAAECHDTEHAPDVQNETEYDIFPGDLPEGTRVTP